MSSILPDNPIALQILVNIPIVSNVLQHICLNKISSRAQEQLASYSREENVKFLCELKVEMEDVEKFADNRSVVIQTIAFAAIALIVTACFGIIPGLVVGACWLGSLVDNYLMAVSAVGERSKINSQIDYIQDKHAT